MLRCEVCLIESGCDDAVLIFAVFVIVDGVGGLMIRD